MVLGPLLFLVYINDLHQVTKHAELHHFADGTNLLYLSKSLKDINQKINFELKNTVHWLRTNKIFCISSFEKAALLPKSYKIQLAFLLFLVALDQLVTPSVLHFSEHLHLIERRKSFGTHLWVLFFNQVQVWTFSFIGLITWFAWKTHHNEMTPWFPKGRYRKPGS